jgi:hypothetical protein
VEEGREGRRNGNGEGRSIRRKVNRTDTHTTNTEEGNRSGEDMEGRRSGSQQGTNTNMGGHDTPMQPP